MRAAAAPPVPAVLPLLLYSRIFSKVNRTSQTRNLPSLRREVLFNLALLTAAAVSLAVVTALIAQTFEPRWALVALVFLIAADVLVVFLFGRYLVHRLVIAPMERLTEAADALAAGNLEKRAPPAETREFTHLAARLNHMTDRLLDMQRQLVRVEKLASIGQLAAGIAHEVGNPLSAIGTYVDVLERRGGDAEVLGAVRREADRIDGIVRGLLAYARPQTEERGPVDVGGVLHNALTLLEQQGRFKACDVRRAIAEELPPVGGKAHLLEQVMVNLLLNAVDAAPKGQIAVGAMVWRYHARSTGDTRRSDVQTFRRSGVQAADADSVPERLTAGPSDRPAGPSDRLAGPSDRLTVRPWRPELPEGIEGVLLWVADSGAGVPEAMRERVFDPFFTTKEPGRGTGLGLAVVERIIYEFGGVVWVDEAREGGAAFKIFLPAAGQSVRRSDVQTFGGLPQTGSSGRNVGPSDRLTTGGDG
jgi:two-component system NtrC family sensor kinase